MNTFERPIYFNKIKPFIDKQLIKVLTGQRRVGKSFMLRLIRDHIKKQKPKANFIYIDKELHEFSHIKNGNDLIEHIETVSKTENNYLFIDEIQEIDGFEIAVRSLLNQGKHDIYCTGSNASILSGEIASMLSGRQIMVRMHSLDYSEYLQFHKKEDSKENLLRYLKYGGLPYLINLPEDDFVIADYLKNIYMTILYRDIVSRHNIRDVKFLENLVRFLAGNTGSLFSAKSITEYLKSQKITKSIQLVTDYIKYLDDAFFVNTAKRADIEGKKIFEIGEKIYFEDLGICNALSGFTPGYIHKNMENAVMNHLLIKDWTVYVGKSGNKEIDFIANKNNEKVYIQVAYLLESDKTIEREFGNLLAIDDNYPKYVVSMDDFSSPNTYKGIKHLTLSEFLLNFR
jgi:predicted AAA+ superfamily ATPase